VYIWEQPDWPRLTWQDGSIAAPLAAVRHDQGRLIGRMEALGFKLREEAVLQTLTQDVVKTSEIEGEQLDATQVRSSLARRLGIDIGALPPTDRNVEGIVEVMLDATRNYQAALTAERLFGWHAALFPTGRSGMTKIIVGDWRDDSTGPMQVVSGPYGREKVHYAAPPAPRVAAEMEAFLTWFNAPLATDPVIKAALAHLWFVTIHPFEDGNGRIARAIADLALARSEGSSQRFYSMSAQIRTERIWLRGQDLNLRPSGYESCRTNHEQSRRNRVFLRGFRQLRAGPRSVACARIVRIAQRFSPRASTMLPMGGGMIFR
jgi:Fic family protein